MGAVVLMVIGITELLSATQRRMQSQLKKHIEAPEGFVDSGISPRVSRERPGSRFAWLSSVFGSGQRGEKARLYLMQAGLRLTVGEYQAIRIGVGIGGLGLVVILTQDLLLGIGGFIMGYMIPGFVVGFIRGKRIKALNSQLVECLELISTSLASGFSFLQGMEAVRNEMPPPLGEEVGRSLRDISLGSGTEDSLAALVVRTGDADLKLAITAVLVQRRVGGNLSEVLNNISTTLRERIRIRGEISTLTAQARGSGMIIGLLPIGLAILLTLVNQSYLTPLYSSTLGRMILGGAVVTEVIGFIFIRKMIEVDF
jgi:tight adherence protein B